MSRTQDARARFTGRGVFPLDIRVARTALAALLLVCALAGSARLRAADDAETRRISAQGQFARAEGMRAALEAKPERQRALQEYQQLISAYRRVYLITPNAVEVPRALKQVGDVYRKMGEQFERSYFESAVEAYEFLAHEYPESSLRGDALLAIAEIQRTNLAEPNLAQQTYQDFLRQYPRSPRAGDANKALAEMHRMDQLDARMAAQARRTAPVAPAARAAAVAPAGAVLSPAPVPSVLAGKAPDQTTGLKHIRVWNAETYSRVIIDLGGQAKYRSARIADPDRIYFDIENAKLADVLLRQPIDIPKGGYLKSVRVAQNKTDTVRVVLEVSQVKDYSVFELPNPDRLVVDVYGPKAELAGAPAPATAASTAAAPAAAPAPVAALTAPAPVAPPAAPIATKAPPTLLTVADRTNNAANSPGKDAATLAPTPASKPAPAPASKPASAPAPATTSAEPAVNGAAAPTVAANRPKTQPRAPFSPVPLGTPAAARAPGVPSEAARKAAADLGPAPLPAANRSGTRTLTRALGLKINRIAIDAGHGGRDTGTIGPTGLMEKDVCLDIALRLGKLIKERLPSAEVVYTRDDDSFVGLEQRTSVVNEAKADLFVSIHANSSQDSRIGGIETYYLNFNASAEAMQVATRENAFAQGGVHDLQELVSKIARNEKIEESRDLAQDVQESLARRAASTGLQQRNRGVRKAPFVVLIGAKMPSVLSEISFLSNPADEQWLKLPENRQHVAEGLYRGIEAYLQSTNSLTTATAPAPIAAERSAVPGRASDRQ